MSDSQKRRTVISNVMLLRGNRQVRDIQVLNVP